MPLWIPLGQQTFNVGITDSIQRSYSDQVRISTWYKTEVLIIYITPQLLQLKLRPAGEVCMVSLLR
jgi:hypothetical protein